MVVQATIRWDNHTSSMWPADLLSDPNDKNREKYVRNGKTSPLENVKIEVTFILHVHATFPSNSFSIIQIVNADFFLKKNVRKFKSFELITQNCILISLSGNSAEWFFPLKCFVDFNFQRWENNDIIFVLETVADNLISASSHDSSTFIGVAENTPI